MSTNIEDQATTLIQEADITRAHLILAIHVEEPGGVLCAGCREDRRYVAHAYCTAYEWASRVLDEVQMSGRHRPEIENLFDDEPPVDLVPMSSPHKHTCVGIRT